MVFGSIAVLSGHVSGAHDWISRAILERVPSLRDIRQIGLIAGGVSSAFLKEEVSVFRLGVLLCNDAAWKSMCSMRQRMYSISRSNFSARRIRTSQLPSAPPRSSFNLTGSWVGVSKRETDSDPGNSISG